ncbi:MAG: hypothetical protein V4591_10665 [Bdellovibrionota bacterium]
MNNLKNVLFIGDPLSSLKLKSDSSLALAEAALKRGLKVYWCESQNISYFNQDIVIFHYDEILAVNVNEVSSKKNTEHRLPFDFFQVCFVRKDPPFNEEYKNLCWILTSQSKVKIINSAEALLSYHEKSLHWRAFAEGVLSKKHMIPTCLSYEISCVVDFCEQYPHDQRFVCKPWLGHGGEDISLFANKELLYKYLDGKDVHEFLVQPFLPEITTEGDRRVIVANGKVIFDYVRLPAQGKIASNGAQGGSAVIREMTEEQMDLCVAIAKFLKNKNILFAGLDLIGTYVGEINITSPTGVRMFETLTNINKADEILGLLVE